MTRYARSLARLHRVGMQALSDKLVDYHGSKGELLSAGLTAIVDHGTDRINETTGSIDRWSTIAVLHADLQKVDRKGYFLLDARQFYIDGIANDDSHLITFYVRP